MIGVRLDEYYDKSFAELARRLYGLQPAALLRKLAIDLVEGNEGHRLVEGVAELSERIARLERKLENLLDNAEIVDVEPPQVGKEFPGAERRSSASRK